MEVPSARKDDAEVVNKETLLSDSFLSPGNIIAFNGDHEIASLEIGSPKKPGIVATFRVQGLLARGGDGVVLDVVPVATPGSKLRARLVPKTLSGVPAAIKEQGRNAQTQDRYLVKIFFDKNRFNTEMDVLRDVMRRSIEKFNKMGLRVHADQLPTCLPIMTGAVVNGMHFIRESMLITYTGETLHVLTADKREQFLQHLVTPAERDEVVIRYLSDALSVDLLFYLSNWAISDAKPVNQTWVDKRTTRIDFARAEYVTPGTVGHAIKQTLRNYVETLTLILAEPNHHGRVEERLLAASKERLSNMVGSIVHRLIEESKNPEPNLKSIAVAAIEVRNGMGIPWPVQTRSSIDFVYDSAYLSFREWSTIDICERAHRGLSAAADAIVVKVSERDEPQQISKESLLDLFSSSLNRAPPADLTVERTDRMIPMAFTHDVINPKDSALDYGGPQNESMSSKFDKAPNGLHATGPPEMPSNFGLGPFGSSGAESRRNEEPHRLMTSPTALRQQAVLGSSITPAPLGKTALGGFGTRSAQLTENDIFSLFSPSYGASTAYRSYGDDPGSVSSFSERRVHGQVEPEFGPTANADIKPNPKPSENRHTLSPGNTKSPSQRASPTKPVQVWRPKIEPSSSSSNVQPKEPKTSTVPVAEDGRDSFSTLTSQTEPRSVVPPVAAHPPTAIAPSRPPGLQNENFGFICDAISTYGIPKVVDKLWEKISRWVRAKHPKATTLDQNAGKNRSAFSKALMNSVHHKTPFSVTEHNFAARTPSIRENLASQSQRVVDHFIQECKKRIDTKDTEDFIEICLKVVASDESL